MTGGAPIVTLSPRDDDAVLFDLDSGLTRTAGVSSTRPFTANVNYVRGETVSNAAIVPVSPTGTVCFYSLVTTDLVVDINGWFPKAG